MRRCAQPIHPAVLAFLFILSIGLASGCQYGVTTPTAATGGTGTGSGGSSGSTSLTYTKDIQPVLSSDCVRCHGPARRDAGVDLSTYTNVMRTVTPGNASSLLILVTRSGGIMNGQFQGGTSARATKAALIRDWIVSSGAAQ
jgi:hypothetical protein